LGGIAAIAIGLILLAFPLMGVAEAPDYSEYTGSESCVDECHVESHEENYNFWKRSGHPYKLMKGEEAQNRPIPTPEGIRWEDVSYVIGGYKWKSRYIDTEGYIITVTGDDGDVEGMNQYNYLIDTWSDYHAGEVDKPYNCGDCHTTGWIPDETPEDDDYSNNQDGLPGMWGTFFAGGVHCEECHGPGTDFGPGMQIDTSRPEGTDPTVMTGAFCGRCHQRYDDGVMPSIEDNYIPASGGFIRHHEQYNTFLASPHAARNCTLSNCPTECEDCHNPHKRGEFSITTQCEDCHTTVAASYAMTSMYDYGVECKDCHMSYASKSAKALGPHQGDLQTHLFSINIDPTASMFEEGGGRVDLDSNGMGAVTMDFACQRCHETAELSELAKFAKDFHDTDKSLADIGLDPGLTGTWWDANRDGEGWLLEVGYANGAMYMFASFYTYAADGLQAYLLAESTAITGNMAEMTVYMTEGAMWGADFNSDDVTRVPWGTGTFTFPTCGGGTVELMANDEMKALGFSDMTTDLTRLLDSGTSCPTFVNNAP
jgi:hypothetical protein